jgi:hypothetical protein
MNQRSFQRTCFGQDGQSHVFLCYADYDSFEKEWHFRVLVKPDSRDWFELTLRECDEKTCQVSMITNNNRDEYRSKGIPEALLPLASKVCGRILISSRQNVAGEAEYRTECAEEMWLRLIEKGLACYDSSEDRYVLKD